MSQAPDITGTEGERLDATVTVDSTFSSQETQTVELRVEDFNSGTVVHTDSQSVTLADSTDSEQITLSWPTSSGDKGVYDLFLESDQDTIQRLVEVTNLSPSQDTPLTDVADHIWYMDEGSGTTVADSIGAKDGTLTDYSNWGAGAGTGNVYPSPQGSGGTIDCGEVLAGLDTWSVALWVRPNSAGSFDQIIVEGLGSAGEQQLTVGDVGYKSAIRFQTQDGTNRDYSLSNSEIDSWLFVAMVADAGSFTGYVYVPGQGQVFNSTNSSAQTIISTGTSFFWGLDYASPIDYGIVVETNVSEQTLTDHFDATKQLYP